MPTAVEKRAQRSEMSLLLAAGGRSTSRKQLIRCWLVGTKRAEMASENSAKVCGRSWTGKVCHQAAAAPDRRVETARTGAG